MKESNDFLIFFFLVFNIKYKSEDTLYKHVSVDGLNKIKTLTFLDY